MLPADGGVMETLILFLHFVRFSLQSLKLLMCKALRKSKLEKSRRMQVSLTSFTRPSWQTAERHL